MISTQDINQNLFDLLTTKNFDLVTRDNKGKETAEPKEAELFSFDYKLDDTNYGNVVITVTSDGNLEVYYGDALGKGMELDHKSQWYDFLYQLRHFARRNMLGFDLKNMNKLKYVMKTRSQVEESKYYGYKNTSYTKPTKEAKLKIVHSKPIDEDNGDARYRNVAALYVESAEGERFKLPFTKLYGGRAMARHVSEGGNPYDAFGQYICELVSDIGVLANFVRASRGKEFSDAGTSVMVEAGLRHYSDLKKKVKRMIGRRGYREELDAFDPEVTYEHEELTDQVRDMFTETLLDTRIEEAIPVLNKLEARNSVMKEVNEFESWANETTQLDLGEGFDPETYEKEIEYEFAGDDGEPGYGHIQCTVNVVDGRPVVDPKSLKATCNGDGNNKLTDEWCTSMVQPGGEEHEEALLACQEEADDEWASRDVDVPMEDAELEEGKMKGLALDMEELSDEEFEKKYQSKKSDWQEVKNKDLRMDPDQPAYIKKMSSVAGDLAAEDTVTEGPTRKDFQMVADLLKANPDPEKRKELANHHADMFAKQNPRFDKSRFLKAAGITEADVDEGNEFTEKLAQARAQGKKEFEVDGKVYQVKEDELKAILRLAR